MLPYFMFLNHEGSNGHQGRDTYVIECVRNKRSRILLPKVRLDRVRLDRITWDKALRQGVNGPSGLRK